MTFDPQNREAILKTRILFLALSFFILAAGANAKLKLPAVIGDHMVLQQQMPLSIWGWDDAGQTVTVSIKGKKGTATADSDGKWKVSLPALLAGGPYTMVVTGSDTVTVQDILVGEVWLGSGQSNMELAMRVTHDSAVEIPAAKYPKIHFFTVDRSSAGTPKDDLNGSWKVCSPETIGDFSAVAYHYGKNLHKALKVPVGLIASDWGGTPIEVWIPHPALEKNPHFAKILDQWDHDETQLKTWTKGYDFEFLVSDIKLLPKNGGKAVPVFIEKGQKGFGGTWNISVKPGSTINFAVAGKGFSGSPAGSMTGLMQGGSWGGMTANFDSGNQAVDLSPYETIEFYAKGHGKMSMTMGQPSITDYDFYNSGPFDLTPEWKRMSYSISSLKQGGWGAHKTFTQDQIQTISFNIQPPYWPEVPSLAYNAMIAPLTPYKIRGAVWYQGESNAGRASQYHELLSTMITSWREVWGEKNFPFLIIQLPNYMQVQNNPSDSDWAKLREAQLQTLDVPNTGLVTTIDIGEAGDIHPKNKTEVGRRAALAGLKTAYGRKIVGSGPLFVTATASKGKMAVTFKEVGLGLKVSGGDPALKIKEARISDPVKGFALAGSDGVFHWADAKIITKKTVIVSSTEVAKPVAVRYAWADNPVCNLVNSAGLPASPFRFSTEPVKEVVAAPTAKGKALPATAGKLLLDDFESGKPMNLIGGPWQVQADNNGLGTTMKNQTQFMVKDGANGSKGSARIYGHYGKLQAPWPYCSIFTSLPMEDPMDISDYKSIEFMAKGDGKLYDVLIFPTQVTDYAHFRHSFTAPKAWTKVHLDLSTFYQPDWGNKVALDFHSVKEILFSPSGMNDEDYDLSIDDVTLVK